MNAAGEAYGQVSLARLLPLRAVTGELRAVPQSGRFVNHMQRQNISLLRRWEDVASNSVLSAPC